MSLTSLIITDSGQSCHDAEHDYDQIESQLESWSMSESNDNSDNSDFNLGLSSSSELFFLESSESELESESESESDEHATGLRENFKKLQISVFEQSKLKVIQFVLMVLRLYIFHRIAFKAMDSILRLMHFTLPSPNSIPRTMYRLRSFIQEYLPKVLCRFVIFFVFVFLIPFGLW